MPPLPCAAPVPMCQLPPEANRLSSFRKEVWEVQERILSLEAKEKAKGNTLKMNVVYVRGLKNNKELRRARKGLDEVEHARNKEANRLSSLHKELRDVQERILAVEAEEKAKGNALKRNAVELEEQLVQGKEVLASNKNESARLNEEIGKTKRELAETVQQAYDDAVNKMMHMTNQGHQKTTNWSRRMREREEGDDMGWRG
jgi:hypothetical protein